MRRRMISAALLLAAAGAACLASVAPATAATATVPHSAAVVQHSSTIGPYPLACAVTASNVNYRRGPGPQYASYGQLGRGFTFASGGEVPNPRIRNRYQYWDTIQRPGHADAYVEDRYVLCWLAK